MQLVSMATVDIHMHLLSGRVRLYRLYDKIAVPFFAFRLGRETHRDLMVCTSSEEIPALYRRVPIRSFLLSRSTRCGPMPSIL